MASAEQLKALLQSHLDGDDERFFSVAMQVAAHEARLGHGRLAKDLRAMIDAAKSLPTAGPSRPGSRPRGELGNLLEVVYPKARLGDMILSNSLRGQIQRVIREQRHADKILEHGLSPRRKLLFVGPPRNRQNSNRVCCCLRTRTSTLTGSARWTYYQIHGGNGGQATAGV